MTEVGEGSHGTFLQRTPIVFPGYSIQGFHCAACGHEWNALALVGTVGVTCPKCGLVDEGFVWPRPAVLMAHDGAWLTAHWDLPVYTAPSTPASGLRSGCDAGNDLSEMVEVAEEGLPWWRRVLLRLQVCWWVLRGEY